MTRHAETKGHLAALFTIFVWGTTFISTKILLRDFLPVEILFDRFLIGFFVLLLMNPRRLVVREKKHELYFIAAGLCGVTLYYLLENIALTFTFASNVGIILSIAPFFTAIFAHLFLKGEPLRPQFFAGFAAAVAGIVLISLNGSALKLNPTGDFLSVLAAIVWAIYSILTKKISEFGYPTIQTTRRVFFYGILLMIPALFLSGYQMGLHRFAKPVNLLNILFLGILACAVCFVTWNSAVKILGATKTSVYIYMAPVITIITSAIVLHENITGMALFGTALTMAGLFLSESKLHLRPKVKANAKE